MDSSIPKKIRNNAAVSYAMIIICLGFLVSKNPQYNHDFIRHHVKVATTLHLVFWLFFYIILFWGIGNRISIWFFSLNHIFMIILWIFFTSLLVYCGKKAVEWKNVIFWKISKTFSKDGRQFISIQEHTDAWVLKNTSIIALAYVPFLWNIIHGRYEHISYLRNIAVLNLYSLSFILLLAVYKSYTFMILFLTLYTFWAIFVIISLISQKKYIHVDISIIPTPTEIYIGCLCMGKHIKNILQMKSDIWFFGLYTKKLALHKKQEWEQASLLLKTPEYTLPTWLLSIPFLSLITLYYYKSQKKKIIENVCILNGILLIVMSIAGIQSPLILLVWVVFCYHAWYCHRIAYHMPIISDIGNAYHLCVSRWKIYIHRFQELRKKEVKGSFTSSKQEHTDDA